MSARARHRRRAPFVVFLMSHSASRGSSDPAPVTLDSLRNRIDQIDAEMHALLMERARTVSDIVAAKGPSPSAIVIQPAREGAVLTRRLDAHEGLLPPTIVTHVWRSVISAFCDLQRPFRVHVAGLSGASGAMRDLARFWFGFAPALVDAADGAAALKGLADHGGDLALVSLSQPGAWWQALSSDGAHVVARFAAPEGEAHDVLLIAGAKVGPAGGAVTVYSLTVQGNATLPILDGVEGLASAIDGGTTHALIASAAPPEALIQSLQAAGLIGSPSLDPVGQYDPALVGTAAFVSQTTQKEPTS